MKEASETDEIAEVEIEPQAPAAEADDYILEPQPAPAPVAAEEPTEEAAEETVELDAAAEVDVDEIIHEAGLMILEENRVAVSMLERKFAIDFDRACIILDRLQERGLIGPYMGGRTREILMTAEEWEAEVSRS